MNREDINPKASEVWTRQGYPDRVVNDTSEDGRIWCVQCDSHCTLFVTSLEEFRDWVGSTGYRKEPKP